MKLRLLLGWSLLTTGCLADTNAALLEIQHAIKPDSSCSYGVSNPSLLTGIYDPMVDASGYQLVVAMRNNIEQRTDDPIDFGVVNVRNRINDVTVNAFEGCWFQYSGDVTRYGSASTRAPLVDCNTLPNQSGTIPANGEIDEGGGTQGLSQATVLTTQMMQQIFGPTFNAADIPILGIVQESAGGGLFVTYKSFESEDPANPNRSVAWGTNYPASREASVVIQLRAVGQLQSGNIVKSDWFIFPITVCPGCFTNSCGSQTLFQCPPSCNDGSTCSSNVCANGTACVSNQQFTGNVGNFATNTTNNVCLTAQGITGPDCNIPQGCTSGSPALTP